MKMHRVSVPGLSDIEIDCDYEGPPSIYARGDGSYACRCIVCAYCGHHTGNSSQGHYWASCRVTKTIRDYHFCCPGRCELEDKAKEGVDDGQPTVVK